MAEKLVIYKFKEVDKEPDIWKKLAVKPSIHKKVSELAELTGRRKNEIANMLISFALEHTEIKDYEY